MWKTVFHLSTTRKQMFLYILRKNKNKTKLILLYYLTHQASDLFVLVRSSLTFFSVSFRTSIGAARIERICWGVLLLCSNWCFVHMYLFLSDPFSSEFVFNGMNKFSSFFIYSSNLYLVKNSFFSAITAVLIIWPKRNKNKKINPTK